LGRLIKHRREIRKKDQAMPGRHDGAAMLENAVGPPGMKPPPDPPARHAVSMPPPRVFCPMCLLAGTA
jgi:hypothetical protein